MPQISVIIPTYNASEYILEAIDSVFNQTYKDYEIIVVDDGSTDRTNETLKEYNSKIRYFYQKNKGPSAARNTGIKNAKGEFIAFLDSDDRWLPQKLELQMNIISKSYSIGLVACEGLIVDTNSRILKHLVLSKRDFSDKRNLMNELLIRNIIPAIPSSAIIRKNCFDVVGLFNENLFVAEDWDIVFRICMKYEFKLIHEPLIKIRDRKNSQSCSGDKNLQNELHFLDNIFSNKLFKINWFLKRKSYSRRYFDAAKTYRANNEIKKARKCILKSFFLFPFGFFDKIHSVLVMHAFLGDTIFLKVQRVKNYFNKRQRE